MELTSAIYGYGRRKLGSALVRTGQEVRHAFNRLTTYFLMKKYAWGMRLHGSYTLAGMLRGMTPFDFGSPKETAFIAATGCEQVVDDFLSGTGRMRVPIELKQFRNGENYARIGETVRGRTVVIFQDFKKGGNVNDTLMETLLAINAAKRADAKQVILICPYLPYIDEPVGSCNYDIDFFKLMLNLLFKAAGLDELRVGNLVVNRQMSALFTLDKIFSRNLAPYMIARGENLLPRKEEKGADNLVFMAGQHYRATAQGIVDQLRNKYEVRGESIDLNFLHQADGKLSCSLDPRQDFVGKTVYIFQTCNTGRINDDFMEALLMAYTARKKGAKEIVLVMPYLPYNRQERKDKARVAISAKLVANALVEAAGVTQIIAMDLHAPATQGFVDIPFQFITAILTIIGFAKEQIAAGRLQSNFVSASPDIGRIKIARKLGIVVIGPNARYAVVDKDRPAAGEASVAAVVGKVKGRDVLLFDDIGDSATTIINAVKALIARGANRIWVALIHPVFSDVTIKFRNDKGEENKEALEEYEIICGFLKKFGKKIEDYVKKDENGFTVNALIRLQANPHIAGIVFTDSISVPEKNIIDRSRIRVISIKDLIATVCGRIIRGESLQGYQHEGQ